MKVEVDKSGSGYDIPISEHAMDHYGGKEKERRGLEGKKNKELS